MCCDVIISERSRAQVLVSNDWQPKPLIIKPGEEFRLLFITSGKKDALSQDIGSYNKFVQGQVTKDGHNALSEYASQFRVVGSTSLINARENTSTEGSGGVPIYWVGLGSQKVADDYGDFYNGS